MVYKITLSQPVPNIFNILESIGDFVIVSKNNYIVNTKKTKRNLVGKFGKVNETLEIPTSVSIIDISKEDISLHSDIVKSWILAYNLQQSIGKTSIDEVSNKALNTLSSFVDTLSQELQQSQEESTGKEE